MASKLFDGIETAMASRIARSGSTTVSLGIDTEFWGEIRDGDAWSIIPGFSFLPHDKGNYYQLRGVGSNVYSPWGGGAIGNDGILAELATNPATCRQALIAEIAIGATGVAMALRKHVKGAYGIEEPKYGKDYRIAILPTTRTFDPDWLESLPEEYQALGCAPSLNAFGDEYRRAPEDSKDTILERTLGTHFHIGNDYIKGFPEVMIQLLELFVNVPLTWYWSNHSEELSIRRQSYGEAGCYRKKNYGLEWRALPALALQSPWTLHLVAGMVRNIVLFAHKAFRIDKAEGKEWMSHIIENVGGVNTLTEVINTSNGAAARDIVMEYEEDFLKAHQWGGTSAIAARTVQWKTFKFLADHPHLQRDDFNQAWKMKALVDMATAQKESARKPWRWTFPVNHSFYGGLSEDSRINGFWPKNDEEKKEAGKFLTSVRAKKISGFQHSGNKEHPGCGRVFAGGTARSVRGTRMHSMKPSETFGFRYCPHCDKLRPTDEWTKASAKEGVY